MWIIQIIMQATAFFALHGAADNQLGNLHQITQLQQIVAYSEVAVVVLNFALQ